MYTSPQIRPARGSDSFKLRRRNHRYRHSVQVAKSPIRYEPSQVGSTAAIAGFMHGGLFSIAC